MDAEAQKRNCGQIRKEQYLDFQFHLQNIHLQIRDLLLKADF